MLCIQILSLSLQNPITSDKLFHLLKSRQQNQNGIKMHLHMSPNGDLTAVLAIPETES